MEPSEGRDFFISYTATNQPWAEWIAVALERAGYTTLLQAWDFEPGTDFLHRVHQATTTAARTIAVLSPAYFGSRFGEAEWRAAFTRDPTGERGLLVPVRVQPCEPPGLLASRVYIDLVDLDETTARRRLLAGVSPGQRPHTAPFPGARGGPTKAADALGGAGRRTRFPGLGPEVSNLLPRNRHFAGREGLLLRLHADLQADAAAAVLPIGAVHGLGGVGKSTLALEYAYRFGSDYDVAWWVPAEQPTAAVAALVGLAGRLGVQAGADQAETVNELFDLLRGRGRWLLVFDNAERPDHLDWLPPPGGGGHILVTSRWSAWSQQASAQRLGTWPRADAVAFLRARTGLADTVGLDALAEMVGDLPLALEEAAAYLDETRVDLDDYLQLMHGRARELFELAGPARGEAADRRRVATVWSVSLDGIHTEAPAAEALLSLCAFLSPDDIPRDLPAEQPQLLPADLATVVGDRLTYNRTLAAIGRYSLAALAPDSIGVHRLVQAVIQARLGAAGEHAWADIAVHVMRRSFPNDSWETTSWPRCQRLMPHLLTAADHAERLGIAQDAAGWLLDRAATYLRERGQYTQARPLAERAVTLTEAALGPDHPESAWRRDTLGRVLRRLGDLPGARTQLERALAISEAALGPHHPDVHTWRNNLGLVLQDLGDLPGARAQLERALAIGETTLGPDHPTVGIRRNNLGGVLRRLGDLSGARAQFEQALAIGETTLSPDHPTVGAWRNNLGLVLEDLGDLPGARAQFERALAISEAAIGPDHPRLGIQRNNLGRVLQELGDLPGARVQFERALAIREAAVGPDHPSVGVWRDNLGRVLRELGDLPGARTQFERALAIGEAAGGPDHPSVGIRRNNLGRVLQDLGDLPGARTQLERALAISEAALGPDHPDVDIIRRNLESIVDIREVSPSEDSNRA